MLRRMGEDTGPIDLRGDEFKAVLMGDRAFGGGNIVFPLLRADRTSVGSGIVPFGRLNHTSAKSRKIEDGFTTAYSDQCPYLPLLRLLNCEKHHSSSLAIFRGMKRCLPKVPIHFRLECLYL